MTRNEFKTENSGENQGVIVGHNSGNINVSIQKVVKIPSLIATVVKTLGEMCVQDYFSDNTDNLQEYSGSVVKTKIQAFYNELIYVTR